MVALDENAGFAGGCNRGVDVATGEWIAFLNNDARPAPDWLQEGIPVLRDDGVACVASKILDWSGQRVDFVDAALSFYGHGFKLHAGEPDDPVYDNPGDVLFASGAAMLVDAEVFRDSGGFDERYFMFFEDVDFGWRLWLQGYRVRYVPTSVVYHRHHAAIDRYGAWREHYLLERNALFTIFKNYDDEHLQRTLAAAVILAIRRRTVTGHDDSDALDLQTHPEGDDVERGGGRQGDARGGLRRGCVLPRGARAPGRPPARPSEAPPLRPRDRAAVQAADVPQHRRRRVCPAVQCRRRCARDHGASSRRVGGSSWRPVTCSSRRWRGRPSERCRSRACSSAEHDVTLVTTESCSLDSERFPVRRVADPELRALVAASDVVVFQGNLMAQHRSLEKTDRIVVADIYDPFHLEVLEQARGLSAGERRLATRASKEVLNQQLLRGDFFLCASEKQRHFWLGQLAAVGQINPATYDEHENLHSLIAVAPFGVSDEPPHHERQVLKGVVPGIGPDDKVILWGGGIYNWFDPLTLLQRDRQAPRPHPRRSALLPRREAPEPPRRRDDHRRPDARPGD